MIHIGEHGECTQVTYFRVWRLHFGKHNLHKVWSCTPMFNQTILITRSQPSCRSAYSQCYVVLLKCAEQNVNNQTLTQVAQLYVHVCFCLK